MIGSNSLGIWNCENCERTFRAWRIDGVTFDGNVSVFRLVAQNAQQSVFSFSCPKTKAGCLHSSLRVFLWFFFYDLELNIRVPYLEVHHPLRLC